MNKQTRVINGVFKLLSVQFIIVILGIDLKNLHIKSSKIMGLFIILKMAATPMLKNELIVGAPWWCMA